MLVINKWLDEMGIDGTKVLECKEEKVVEKVKMWRARHMMRMVLESIGCFYVIAGVGILYPMLAVLQRHLQARLS